MVERIGDGEARSAREHTFTRPWRYILNMLLFVGVIGGLGYWGFTQPNIQEQVFAASSRYINGSIVILFVLGVAYTFHQTLGVGPAVAWLRDFQHATRFDGLRRPPAMVSPMAVLLAETPGRLRISTQSARSMLDSVGARMSEAGEITRYITRLLIFLGLLGTFWGLLNTVGGVIGIVAALSDSAETSGAASVSELFDRLQGPLDGMATAFSSSIFGLAGSLALGFLDLQATQAQNRFYNEVEDWLSSISRVGVAGPGGDDAGASSHLNAMFEDTARSLDALQTAIAKAEESRARGNESLSFLATELSQLNERLSRQEQALVAIKERAIDDTVSRHVRSIDVTLQRLANDGAVEREQNYRELRSELRTLARAISDALAEVGDRRGDR